MVHQHVRLPNHADELLEFGKRHKKLTIHDFVNAFNNSQLNCVCSTMISFHTTRESHFLHCHLDIGTIVSYKAADSRVTQPEII